MNEPAAAARVGLQRHDIGRFEIHVGDSFEHTCGDRPAFFYSTLG